MAQRTELIYSERIRPSNLLGEPELLRWDGRGYVAGDIKSGSGEEGEDIPTFVQPSPHYCPNSSVHARGITSTCQHCDAFHFILCAAVFGVESGCILYLGQDLCNQSLAASGAPAAC